MATTSSELAHRQVEKARWIDLDDNCDHANGLGDKRDVITWPQMFITVEGELVDHRPTFDDGLEVDGDLRLEQDLSHQAVAASSADSAAVDGEVTRSYRKTRQVTDDDNQAIGHPAPQQELARELD